MCLQRNFFVNKENTKKRKRKLIENFFDVSLRSKKNIENERE